MSGLEIIPDPWIVGVQASIFFGNLLICKKFFAEPFQRLLKTRESFSTDLDKQAAEFKRESLSIRHKIQEAIHASDSEVAIKATEMENTAKIEKASLLQEAKISTTKAFELFQDDLERILNVERPSLATEADKLANEMYRKVWGGA